MWKFAVWDLRTIYFFAICGLSLLQSEDSSKSAERQFFSFSYSKIYTEVGKNNFRSKPMRIWIRNTAFFLAYVRISDLRTETPSKFANLLFADYSLQICGFAICGLTLEICGFRLRKEPKSQRACHLRKNKKNCVPTFGAHINEPTLAY